MKMPKVPQRFLDDTAIRLTAAAFAAQGPRTNIAQVAYWAYRFSYVLGVMRERARKNPALFMEPDAWDWSPELGEDPSALRAREAILQHCSQLVGVEGMDAETLAAVIQFVRGPLGAPSVPPPV